MEKIKFYYNLCIPILMGCAFVIMARILEAVHTNIFGIELFESAYKFFDSTGSILITAGVIYVALYKALQIPIKYFLEFITKPIYESYKNITDDIKGKIPDHTALISKFITEPQLKEYLDANTQNTENNIVALQLGNHSTRSASLYNYLRKNIMEPFCRSPHKSQYESTIKIEFIDSDTVKWTDETSFKIHHPEFNTSKLSTYYALTTELTNINTIDGNEPKPIALSVAVDNAKILSKKQRATSVETIDKNEEGYQVEHKGSFSTYFFKKNILLKKEWTDVSIKEISITPSRDKTFTFSVYEPYYTVKYTIILPKEYTFNRSVLTSNHCIFMGLPTTQQSEELLKNTQVSFDDDENSCTVHMQGWVLPGPAFSIDWQETPPPTPLDSPTATN
ncbi:hypothetical protein DA2_3182 [Desulfovibrio sp. A2]|nr:hypothetical protein DA2_3182 [Desulfovibrio sp. A2]